MPDQQSIPYEEYRKRREATNKPTKMKTKLALITLTALASCDTQAININMTHHDFERVSFTLTDIDVQGFTTHRDTYGILARESIFGISANSRSDGIVQVSINWVHPTHPFEDTFHIGNGIVPTTDFDGDSYRQIGNRTWEWTYVRPPIVPDNGSMLAGLGVALVGLWRIKR